jgi:hypothetical protein
MCVEVRFGSTNDVRTEVSNPNETQNHRTDKPVLPEQGG